MITMEEDNTLRQRMLAAGVLLLLVVLGGTFGYWGLSRSYLPADQQWSLGDCAYMTAISITTVGYGEVIQVSRVPYGRLLTVVIIFAGLGVAVYFASALTAFVVEGEFQQLRKRRRMKQQMAKVSGHIIVCGIGTSGLHVVTELLASRWQVVCVDSSEERVRRVHDLPGGANVPCILGDATADEVLKEAGIDRARGVIASLSSDKENLFVVISARQLNPQLKIVAKGVDIGVSEKLRRAGADVVVTPAYIGGIRMVSEMVRPHVTEFLDIMLRDKDKNLRIEEVNLPPDSPLVGKLLSEARIRETTDLLIVAVRTSAGGPFVYNPGPQLRLAGGNSLIVLGGTSSVQKLRQAVGHVFAQPRQDPSTPTSGPAPQETEPE
ncbi:MAG: potassium channel protein [Deltaproteobacteria bacterium]|nr:potassium channel protein [Deltaproteobacteria bacterium]